MSKINDLINKLCPNGVRFYQIKDIAKVTIGEFVHKNKQTADGEYPVYNGGTSNTGFYDEYNNDGQKVIISARGANAGFINRVRGKYWAGNSCYTININDETLLDWNFLYQYLKNNQKVLLGVQQTGSIPSISKKQVEDFKIAVPPLKVQEEIVRILDKFGELEAELEAELETELEARQNQCEFWREKIINMYESKNIKLSDMAKVYDGTHSTPNYQLFGIPFISVENISNIYSSNKYISEEDFQKYKIKPQINDVFMTRIGSIGKCSVFDKQVDLAYYVSLALIRPNIDVILPKYLKYVIESNIGKYELYRRTLVHAVPIKVNKDEIGKIVLPVPSIEDQRKIISILDEFEILTESISVGLSAEIELRKKQYEYYRNKLLSFEELSVSE